MKKTILFLFLTIISQSSFSQNISAGSNTYADYYHSYQPPLEIHNDDILTTTSIFIDLNMDGTSDIMISNDMEESMFNMQEHKLTIRNLSTARIAFSENDTCYSSPSDIDYDVYAYHVPIVNELNENDIIDENLNWTNQTVTLGYYHHIPSVFSNLDPLTCSYFSPLISSTGYLGIKLIDGSETYFSWIEVSNVTVNSCVIHSFATSSQNLSINKNLDNTNTLVYPNPAETYINVKSDTEISTIELRNSLGKIIKTYTLDSNFHSINTESLSPGFYSLYLKNNNGRWISEKIILK